MYKTLLTLVLLFVISFSMPVEVQAQTDDAEDGIYCPHLTRKLKRGMRDANSGGEVSELQQFISD
ncbi:MAG: hypothetical protein RIQ56_388, partial [Candidatus Parcubacteria bacterium]